MGVNDTSTSQKALSRITRFNAYRVQKELMNEINNNTLYMSNPKLVQDIVDSALKEKRALYTPLSQEEDWIVISAHGQSVPMSEAKGGVIEEQVRAPRTSQLIKEDFHELLLVLLQKGANIDSNFLKAIYRKLYQPADNMSKEEIQAYETRFVKEMETYNDLSEQKRRRILIGHLFDRLAMEELANVLIRAGLIKQDEYDIVKGYSDVVVKGYLRVALFQSIIKRKEVIPGYTAEEALIFKYLPYIVDQEGKQRILLQKQNRPILEKIIEARDALTESKPKSFLLTVFSSATNSIFKSAINEESRFERFRRRHSSKIANGLGLILALGGSALILIVAAASFGAAIAIPLTIANFVINYELYRGAMKGLLQDGLFTAYITDEKTGLKGPYKITSSKYQGLLIGGYTLSTIVAAALGLLTTLAIISLTVSTFGVGAAVALGVLVGAVTFGGNVPLFGGAFQTLFAYLEYKGFNRACKKLWEDFRNTFLSIDDCRKEHQRTGESLASLVCKKIFRVAFQSLFTLGAVALAVFVSFLFVGILKTGFVDFVKGSSELGAKIAGDIMVVGATFVAQLSLGLNTSIRFFGNIGRRIGEMVGSFFVDIGAAIATIRKDGLVSAAKQGGSLFAAKCDAFAKSIVGAGKFVSNYFKQHSLWEVIKSASDAVYYNAVLPVFAAANAFVNGFFMAGGAKDLVILPVEARMSPAGSTASIVAGSLNSAAVGFSYIPTHGDEPAAKVMTEDEHARQSVIPDIGVRDRHDNVKQALNVRKQGIFSEDRRPLLEESSAVPTATV